MKNINKMSKKQFKINKKHRKIYLNQFSKFKQSKTFKNQ